MTKAYLTGPRGIKLPNGSRLQHGQIIGGDPMQNNPQRGLNTAYNVARDGAPKRTEAAPVKPGMTRQTKGDLHPYLHGQAAMQSVWNTPTTPTRMIGQ